MPSQNLPPKNSRIILVQTPAGDLLFYDRVEAGKYRDAAKVPAMGTPHSERARWPNHELCGIAEDGEEGWLRFYYAATRQAQQAYNFELSRQLNNEWPEIEQTWVVKRQGYTPGAIVAPPALGGFVWTFIGDSQIRTDPTTDGLFVVLRHTYRDIRQGLQHSRVDDETGFRINETRRMVPAGTQGTPVQTDGTYSEVRDINTLWAIEEVKKLRGLAGSLIKTETWDTTVLMRWPRVLHYPAIDVIPAAGGGIGKIFFVPVWLRPEYYGPCKATITRQWTRAKPTVTPPTPMLEDAIAFEGGLLAISIPACLHRDVRLFEGTGKGNPKYAPYQLAWNYPATNFVDWPASITWQNEVERDQGGYMQTIIEVHRPAIAITASIVLSVSAISPTGWTLSWEIINGVAPGSYLLDIAEDPEFSYGFLAGYKGKSSTSLTEVVTGAKVGKAYFCRVRATALVSNTVTGMARPVPLIQVQYPIDTPLTHGQWLDWGVVYRGERVTRTFRIKNVGTWPLTDLQILTEHLEQFSASTLSTTTLSEGEYVDVEVWIDPAVAGALSGGLVIASSDGTHPEFSVTFTGSAVEAHIQVEQPASSILTSGVSTRSWGSVFTGAFADLTFTIRSIGSGSLRDIGVTFAGDNAAEWRVQTAPPEVIAPSTSATFVVRFAPGSDANGAQTAVLLINSNAFAQESFSVSMTGTAVSVPEIQVEDPLGAVREDAIGTFDLGRVQNGSLGDLQTVTIRNVGGANLTSLALSKSGTNSADFTLGALGATTVAPGATTTFTVRFAPVSSGGGIRTAMVSIASNDADENPFRLILNGTEGSSLAEIQVEYPLGTLLVDGSSVLNWGNVPIGVTPPPRTITIRNIGNANLTGLAVSKSGDNSADVSYSSLGSTTLLPGTSTTFDVLLSAVTRGYKDAAIAIASNDADENPFDIGVTGIVMPPNALTTGQSASVVIGQANFTAASGTLNASTLGSLVGGVAVCPVTGRLAICDSSNSRVLIWNSVPTLNGTPADYVLGQPNFTTNSNGVSRTKMNTPRDVAFSPDGTRLFVVDQGNIRVLIYDMTATLANGMQALLVMGQTTFTGTTVGVSATKFTVPIGVHITASGAVLVADTSGGYRVLIWNSIPTSNGAAASNVIGQANFTNTLVGQDATYTPYPSCVSEAAGRIYIGTSRTDICTTLRVWDSLPVVNGAAASRVLGAPNYAALDPSPTRKLYSIGPTAVAVSSSNHLAVATGNRVLIYYNIPLASGLGADAVLGQPDFVSDVQPVSNTASNLRTVRGLCWVGNRLLVSTWYRTLIFQP